MNYKDLLEKVINSDPERVSRIIEVVNDPSTRVKLSRPERVEPEDAQIVRQAISERNRRLEEEGT